jgi:hypothetical protein
MNDTYKISDTYRQSQETETARIEEAKGKVVRDSENSVISKLINFYGNGVLAAESEANLNQIDGATSSDIVFDGTVKVSARVTYQNGIRKVAVEVPVKGNELELAADEDLKDLVNKAEAESEETFVAPESFELKADLSQFKVYDDGSDYLKVYHPVLDSGNELGIISKDEYNSLQNKESFFKDVLANHATNPAFENHYTLQFEGSFAEPQIEFHAEKEIVTAADFEDRKVVKTAAQEPVEEPTNDEDNLFLAHQADTLSQSIQFEQQNSQTDLDRIAIRLSNDIVSHLRSLEYDDVKVLSVDNSDAASFRVTASLLDSYGEKVITFSVPVRASSYTLPKKEVVADLIAKTRDLQSIIAEDIAKDTLEKINQIDENERWGEAEVEAALKGETIEKKAGAEVGGVQYVGPVDVLNIDKHTLVSSGIPEDLEIGSVIFADGFHWKLTSKDTNSLSKEADSGLWSFSKVPPTDKTPEHELKV